MSVKIISNKELFLKQSLATMEITKAVQQVLFLWRERDADPAKWKHDIRLTRSVESARSVLVQAEKIRLIFNRLQRVFEPHILANSLLVQQQQYLIKYTRELRTLLDLFDRGNLKKIYVNALRPTARQPQQSPRHTKGS